MRLILTIALSTALFTQQVHAQTFDPQQCARIQDVELPYEVAVSGAEITFTRRGDNIVVGPQIIRAGGRSHESPAVAAYHERLRVFLRQADVMAREGMRAMNPLARDSGLGSAATSMCQAILDLAASTVVIEDEFRDYASPVRIQLNR